VGHSEHLQHATVESPFGLLSDKVCWSAFMFIDASFSALRHEYD